MKTGKQSLGKRLYRTVFAITLVIIVLALGASEMIDDGLEQAILDRELVAEQAYFQTQIDGGEFQSWQTATLRAVFLPQGEPEQRLPAYLRDLQLPFANEVEASENTYLVIAERVTEPAGNLYVSREISVMEQQEFFSGLTLLIVALLVALVGVVLSYFNVRQLVRPLETLTHHIRSTEPGKSMPRLETEYRDLEFAEIATAFNRFLDALEAFVEREKSFVKLASHELRSPLAVISGALDVLESRGEMSDRDYHTLARIRRASRDMTADVNVLLKLARGSADEDTVARLNLSESVQDTIADLANAYPDQAPRVVYTTETNNSVKVVADPALVRMLIRNLIQNAIQHTRSTVNVCITRTDLWVSDSGHGLPGSVIDRLREPPKDRPKVMQETTFGLLIVQLVCERLGWQMSVVRSDDRGTEICVHFDQSGATL